MAKLKIRIYKDGTIESRTEGVTGEKCMNYVEQIAALTESAPVYIEKTQEYFLNQQENLTESDYMKEESVVYG
ncbi:MAG: DUF2997 domain-containing protein [Oscillospiraceae bacterium]|nr:DUF2997 domain-containing protein [Oscillospiraceae bacterium]